MQFGNFFGLIKPKPRYSITPLADGRWRVRSGNWIIADCKTMKAAQKAIDNLKRPTKYID